MPVRPAPVPRAWMFRRSRLDSAASTLPVHGCPAMRRFVTPALLCLALAAPGLASAQQYEIDLSRLDPAAVLSTGGDVLRRASGQSVDDLFQAVLHASREPKESRALCPIASTM